MDDWVWIAIGVAAALIVLLALVLLVTRARRRHRSKVLRDRFGPEYDRVVGHNGREEGEEALRERMRQHDSLALRDVTDEEREAALASWQSVQMTFVESPATAVRDGEHLVFEVLRERGYPLESVEDRASAISVEEPELAGRYREAHAALVHAESNGAKDMTRLRDALLTYRTLLYRLVGAPETPGRLTTSSPTNGQSNAQTTGQTPGQASSEPTGQTNDATTAERPADQVRDNRDNEDVTMRR